MIQYPKNKHITLPSIEGGFGSMNILKDPPKAIYTRFKPKVGDTSNLNEAIDASGDRGYQSVSSRYQSDGFGELLQQRNKRRTIPRNRK